MDLILEHPFHYQCQDLSVDVYDVVRKKHEIMLIYGSQGRSQVPGYNYIQLGKKGIIFYNLTQEMVTTILEVVKSKGDRFDPEKITVRKD